MIQIIDKVDCCGCTACVGICPKHCIRMTEDTEGFLYPQVDKAMCIDCGLCEKICPILNTRSLNSIPDSIIVQNKNEQIRRESTSGGFYSAIGEYVLKNDGCVFGAAYNSSLEVIYKGIEKIEDLHLFRGSKYVQSNPGNTFIEVKDRLKNGQLVCYSGTPCHIAGLKNFLRKEYDNLITVDVVCRGVPSPLLFKKYLCYQQDKYHSEILNVKFRDKYYGYDYSTMSLGFENRKKKYHAGVESDLMLNFFFLNLCSRPSCYKCAFKTIARVSDFTISDCWNVRKFDNSMDNCGTTHVFIHSEKGKAIFNVLKPGFRYGSTDLSNAIRLNGSMIVKPVPNNKKRDEFFKDLQLLSLDKMQEKYYPITIKRRIIKFIKPVLYKVGIFSLYLRLKKE